MTSANSQSSKENIPEPGQTTPGSSPATPAFPVKIPKRKSSGVLTMAAKFEQDASVKASSPTNSIHSVHSSNSNPHSTSTPGLAIISKMELLEKSLYAKPSSSSSSSSISGFLNDPSSPTSPSSFSNRSKPNKIVIPKTFDEAHRKLTDALTSSSTTPIETSVNQFPSSKLNDFKQTGTNINTTIDAKVSIDTRSDLSLTGSHDKLTGIISNYANESFSSENLVNAKGVHPAIDNPPPSSSPQTKPEGHHVVNSLPNVSTTISDQHASSEDVTIKLGKNFDYTQEKVTNVSSVDQPVLDIGGLPFPAPTSEEKSMVSDLHIMPILQQHEQIEPELQGPKENHNDQTQGPLDAIEINEPHLFVHSPTSISKHITSPSLPRNITGLELSSSPAERDPQFDVFDEYNTDEIDVPTTNLSSPLVLKSRPAPHEAFRFPATPRSPSHGSSTSHNITGSIGSGLVSGIQSSGLPSNSYPTTSILPQSESSSFPMSESKPSGSDHDKLFNDPNCTSGTNSKPVNELNPKSHVTSPNPPYVMTFEALTNIPEKFQSISRATTEKTDIKSKSLEGAAPQSSDKNPIVLGPKKNSHSFSLNPIELDHEEISQESSDIIYAVCVVGFHHIRGPEVEYWIGGDSQDHSKLWPNLPFQSLPDGSHSHEENFCYFSILYDTKHKSAPISVPIRDRVGNIIENVRDMTNVTTLFGISCNRQVKSSDLKEKPADVTRSTVQKSVVVIAKKPIFGAIREKLAVITRAYFQQGDFADRSLIKNLYENLVQMFSSKIDENDMYVGMSLRELIFRLRSKVLVLLKALLLEKKIFFFGSNTEALCASQFALVSLIPDLINHLDDSGSPLLKSYETKLRKPTSLKSSDRSSLLHYMGLPLQIFSEGGMFTGYVPLQQMNELKAPETKYFLVGSTNSLLLAPQNRVADIVVYIDSDNVEIINTSLNNVLSLSTSDKKWIDSIVQSVVDTWDPDDPWRPKGLGFRGSEDFVRQQFEDYLMGLLSSVKYDRFLSRISNSKQQISLPREVEGNPIKLFNNNWVKEWRTSNNFRIFSKFTDDELFDIVEPRHIVSSLQGNGYQKQTPPSDSDNYHSEDKAGVSTQDVAKKVSRAWNSFWWGQQQQDSADPSISMPPHQDNNSSNFSGQNLNDNLNGEIGGNNKLPLQNMNKFSHQTKPSDDFQDASLFDKDELDGSSDNNVIGTKTIPSQRKRSTTVSTTASNSNTLTPTRSSSSNTSSSQKSQRSGHSSGFFNGWSFWGNGSNSNHSSPKTHGSSNTSVVNSPASFQSAHITNRSGGFGRLGESKTLPLNNESTIIGPLQNQ